MSFSVCVSFVKALKACKKKRWRKNNPAAKGFLLKVSRPIEHRLVFASARRESYPGIMTDINVSTHVSIAGAPDSSRKPLLTCTSAVSQCVQKLEKKNVQERPTKVRLSRALCSRRIR